MVAHAPLYNLPADECVTITEEPEAVNVSLPPVKVSSDSTSRYVPVTVTVRLEAPSVESRTRTIAGSALAGAASGTQNSSSIAARASASFFLNWNLRNGLCMTKRPFCYTDARCGTPQCTWGTPDPAGDRPAAQHTPQIIVTDGA